MEKNLAHSFGMTTFVARLKKQKKQFGSYSLNKKTSDL
jgi:hypothetical protein